MKLIRSDLDFILAQIIRAETDAPLESPNLPFGLARLTEPTTTPCRAKSISAPQIACSRG